MRTYTAHLKAGRPPTLVREGWSWGAALFGWVWLLAQRAWIPALLQLAISILVLLLVPPPLRSTLMLAIAFLTGLLGRDMVRWSLARRGYVLAHILAARDEDGALARLLQARRDLAERYAELLA